jgi:anti-sigma28 factor (negative regulator of flagellin synthesis)
LKVLPCTLPQCKHQDAGNTEAQMSLRIQGDPAAGLSSTEAGGVSQTASLVAGSAKGRTTSGSAGGDQVEVSSVAEAISARNSAVNLSHAGRVAQLGALYASGKYTVDSAQVSHALVDNALDEPASGKE